MRYRAHTGVLLNLVYVGQVQAGGKGKCAGLKNEPDIGLHLTSIYIKYSAFSVLGVELLPGL